MLHAGCFFDVKNCLDGQNKAIFSVKRPVLIESRFCFLEYCSDIDFVRFKS